MKSPRRSSRISLRRSRSHLIEHHEEWMEDKERMGSMDSIVDYKAVLDIKRLGEAVEEAMS
jgi:hypothetical protein